MRAVKQIWRGMHTLPGVGSHPGNQPFTMFVLFAAAAGINVGVIGMLIGSGIMAIGLAPFYLYGAYCRANISDRMTRKG